MFKNSLHSCHNFPAGSRQAARGARICLTSLIPGLLFWCPPYIKSCVVFEDGGTHTVHLRVPNLQMSYRNLTISIVTPAIAAGRHASLVYRYNDSRHHMACLDDCYVCCVFSICHCRTVYYIRADSRFAFSQWETALLCNDISDWLGTSLDLTWLYHSVTTFQLTGLYFHLITAQIKRASPVGVYCHLICAQMTVDWISTIWGSIQHARNFICP